MTSYTVICQNNECDTTCPDASCLVPRTATLRGLIWWDGVSGPDDPNLKKTEYEVKNGRRSVVKWAMNFEMTNQFNSSIWSFEFSFLNHTDVLPQDDWQGWQITAKQKIEGNKATGKLQTEKFELTTIDLPQTSEPSDRPSSSPSGVPSSEPSVSTSPSEGPTDIPSSVPSGKPACVYLHKYLAVCPFIYLIYLYTLLVSIHASAFSFI